MYPDVHGFEGTIFDSFLIRPNKQILVFREKDFLTIAIFMSYRTDYRKMYFVTSQDNLVTIP